MQSGGDGGAPADGEQGGLVTRDRHVFKVPAPKTSLLGEQAVDDWARWCM